MNIKLLLVIIVFLAFAGTTVDADIYFDRLLPRLNDSKRWGYKCVPGRSYIMIGKPKKIIPLKQTASTESSESDEDQDDGRRTHMNSGIKEENCIICLCSLDGKEKHCVGRPARNVNECIRMSQFKKEVQMGIPYSHDRILAYRIRRDYVWHYDEIPYNAKAKCKRGVTYYSNNVNANDTDIESDVESLLSYNSTDICYYCVCSVDGTTAGCISRDPWYCEYYKFLRDPNYSRARYAHYFRQDRPTYFRTLSYRMRRRMDDGLYALLDIVGSGDTKCIPYVSEFSDCSEANSCSGCNKCSCDKDGNWVCQRVVRCPVGEEDEDDNEEVSMNVALESLLQELREEKSNKILVPPPTKLIDDTVLDNKKFEDYFEYPTRRKRSLNDNVNKNRTITFYNAVDDINEDTLKNSSKTGTVKANKFVAEVLPKNLRRSLPKESKINPGLNKLHIEPNEHQEYNHHSAENKIDSADEKKVGILDKKILKILGNYTQDKKDRDVSKLVADELKKGVEIIGEKNMTPVSNVTFTPENDTLTAMAFIAGNLLNKLWNMEKYSNYGSIEADALKHEKINDLLDLFKEPLSIRQETFLKNALKKLSQSLDRNKHAKNITICETYEENISDVKNINKNVTKKTIGNEATTTATEIKNPSLNITTAALSKLNNVLDLIHEFERVQKNINHLKAKPQGTNLSNDDLSSSDTLGTFGNILNKISKLLIPNHYENTKHRVHNLNYLRERNDIKVNNQNINFNDVNMTMKDKIVLDYITHMENNPSCLYKNDLQAQVNKNLFKVEGSIFKFLSQFLNMEAFEKLLKSLNLEIKKDVFRENIATTEKLAQTDNSNKIISSNIEKSKLQVVKDKLKNHLKAIVDDLVELQTEDGDGEQMKKINIAQALPCIFNILNEKNLFSNTRIGTKANSLNKIKSLINSLKLDFQSKRVTRRKFSQPVSSQSAQVFERVIKNINMQLKQKTRRSLNKIKPKTYEQLINMISNVENTGNSYKSIALSSNVSPKNRLMLLKALEADVKQHENILRNVQASIDVISNLPQDKQKEIEEFVKNSQTNIDLSNKVIRNILENKIPNKIALVEEFEDEKKANVNKFADSHDYDPRREPTAIDIKVTKDKIINQLMVNRVNAYLQMKDATESNPKNDIKYNVAVHILSQMKSGNTELAKELFKFFLSNNDRESLEKPTNVLQDQLKSSTQPPTRRGSLILALKEPLIAIHPKDPGSQDQDSLLKQLMNLQSI